MKQEYFRVGVFANTHGIKGEIKVYPTTEDIKRFDDLKSVIFDTKNGHIEFEIIGVKYFKGMPILKFKDVEKIEDIESYKGCDLLVSRENAIPLNEGEHYVADLIGLSVITDEGEKLGIVKDVFKTGSNAVYVVKREEQKDLLIPQIPDCVLEINIDEGFVRVHLMDGLLDL